MQEQDETRTPFWKLNTPIMSSACVGWLDVVGRRWGNVTFVFQTYRVGARCYGPALLIHIPSLSSHSTNLIIFATAKLFESAVKEKSHSTLFTSTLNILPQQEASDNRYRSAHSDRSCKSYPPSVPASRTSTRIPAHSTNVP